MFGWITASLKKIIAAILLAALIYAATQSMGFSHGATLTLILALSAGMIFPDIDVITGFFKKALHSMVVFIFILAFIIIALYPASIQISGSMCSESLTSSIFGISGLGAYCNAATALAFLAACYIIARAAVGWLPDKNMLHSYMMAALVTLCAAIFAKFSLPPGLFLPAVISFAAAYLAHLAIDSGHNRRR